MSGAETRAAQIGLLALICFGTATLGLPFTAAGGGAVPIWPPAGVALALLLLLGPEIWPGAWLGAGLAAFSAGVPLPAAVALGGGQAVTALLQARLLRRAGDPASLFQTVGRVSVFGLISSLGCALAATVGTIALWQGNLVPVSDVAQTWGTWWLGDWTSVLVMTPLVVVWHQALRDRSARQSLRRDLYLLAAALPLGLALLWPPQPVALHRIGPFAALPALTWASFRFERRQVLTPMALLLAVLIAATLHGHGPFHAPDPDQALLEVLPFVAILALTCLAVSALAEERRRVEFELRVARDELETSVQERTSALRESEDTFAKAFHSSPIGLAISSVEEGRILVVNDSLLSLLGYAREEVVGATTCSIGVFPGVEERERMRTCLLADGTYPEVELVVRSRSGEERDCRFSAEIIEIGGVRQFLICLRDVTDTRRAEKLITHLAYHDSLTGLPNRLHFQDRFELAILRAQKHGHLLGVLFLDLDRFKVVNDSLGHAAGDRFLRRVAERLVRTVRAGDTVVRLGGDEFVVLLGEIQVVEDVGRVARKILDNLAHPYELDQREIFATASIGASVYPIDGKDGETLLRHADAAMYRAKSLGGDVFQLFTPTMNRRASERLGLEAELHRALRAGEFVVYYQPQLTLASNRIDCVEALVRWRHPARGLLQPRSFMRVAEQTGLIVSIDQFVLRQACRDLVAWKREGLPPMKVAVNVSLRQFQQEDLVQRIREIITETGADPRQLDLEINENVAISSIRSHRDTTDELKSMGLCLSLDDFGHGHSSLNHLRELPIDTVKIDRSFVRRSTRDPRDAAIARTLISMAHTLHMRVVAEGVDSRSLLDFFRREKCDSIQGFYFSRPVPAPMLKELLATWDEESVLRPAA